MQQYSTSRSKRQLFRVLTYVGMTAAVIIISTICVLLVLGYQFNFQKRTVEQGGLLQFQTTPTSATVTLDGQLLSFSTPGKQNVDAGQHTVVMQKQNYRTWSKTFPLAAGELRWLNYARLIPDSVTTDSILDMPSVGSDKPSPDKKWLAVITDSTAPHLTIADLRDTSKVTFKTLDIVASAYTAPVNATTQKFTIMEWDFGSRFILVKHDFDSKSEYLRLDRTDENNTKNLNTQFGIDISEVHFSGTNGVQFYGTENGHLRKIDLGANSLSAPIAQNVTSFSLYSNADIVYVMHQGPHYMVGVYFDGTTHQVKTYDDTQPIFVASSTYFGDRYVAISYGTATSILKNPQDSGNHVDLPVALNFSGPIKWLEFSSNGRFVVAGSGSQFVTYDIETKQTFSTNLPGVPADDTQPLQWIDDYIFASNADNNLRLTEFDGANQQVITDDLQGYSVTLSADGKYIYSFTKNNTGGVSLQASKLIIGN